MGADDQICQMDTVTTASGSHAYADFVPDEDDVVVERIRAAGAVVIGKTFTFLFNFTGRPAATVPAGFTEDGLPVGLQIVGRRLDDALVLRASAAYEAAAPWRDHWPPVLAKAGL
jgi:Asp-tRNA(Asn)/Glu-tRNA(Gln) amidotransferase A subunit family amidase